MYACCFIIVYFVSRRNSDCSDTQTRFSLKVKVRNRVTATRRAKKTYTKEESAPSSTVTSLVSNSGLDSIYDKKRPSDKPDFSVQLGPIWSYWPDLNRRPADYESAALPTEPQ